MMRNSVVPTVPWSLFAGVAAAVGASACCVLPLLLVSLGISGAWMASLTALEPWRPWFMGGVVLALGMASWRLYGPAEDCAVDRVCADPRIRRRQRVALWIVVAIVLPLLAFPYFVQYLF